MSSNHSDPYVGNEHSVDLMRRVDGLDPQFRELIHEYGFVIVAKMIDEGYWNAGTLRDMLETWRERRQAEWLRTDYVTKRTRESFGVVNLTAHMERVRKMRALKIATAEKLKAMILEEAERCAS